MCSSHQPEQGADSAIYYRYRVPIHADFGSRFDIEVKAIGPHGATETAIYTAEAAGHFDVRPGTPVKLGEAA